MDFPIFFHVSTLKNVIILWQYNIIKNGGYMKKKYEEVKTTTVVVKTEASTETAEKVPTIVLATEAVEEVVPPTTIEKGGHGWPPFLLARTPPHTRTRPCNFVTFANSR